MCTQADVAMGFFRAMIREEEYGRRRRSEFYKAELNIYSGKFLFRLNLQRTPKSVCSAVWLCCHSGAAISQSSGRRGKGFAGFDDTGLCVTLVIIHNSVLQTANPNSCNIKFLEISEYCCKGILSPLYREPPCL